jgi:hypothetical protein
MSQQWEERIPVLFAVLGLKQALFNLQMLVWYEIAGEKYCQNLGI